MAQAADTQDQQAVKLPKPGERKPLSQSIFHLEKKDASAPGKTAPPPGETGSTR